MLFQGSAVGIHNCCAGKGKWSMEGSTEKLEFSIVKGSKVPAEGITELRGSWTTALKWEKNVVRNES